MLLRTGLVSLFALCMLASLEGCCGHMAMHGRMAAVGEPSHGISVSGYGEAKAAPDLARANLGVEFRSETVEVASTQASEHMTAVLNALKTAGVAANDLRTQNFSISFEQEQQPPVVYQAPQESMAPAAVTAPAPAGKRANVASVASAPAASAVAVPAPEKSPVPRGYYRVSNVVEVTVRDVNKLGQLLKTALDAGANNVWGVSFELADPQPILAKARAEAIAHAKQNAEALAQLTGVKLGPIVSINENGSSGQPMPMMMKAMAAGNSQDVPIERGEISVNESVQLVYAIP